MKKSFIAIAIAAITSTSTFASTVNHHDAIAVDSSSFHVEKSADGNDYLFVDGKPIGKIEEYNEEQGKAVLSPMRGAGEIRLSTHKHGHIDYVSFDGDGNQDRGSLIVTEKNKIMDETSEIMDTIDESQKVAERVENGKSVVELRDGQGNVVETIDASNVERYVESFSKMSDEEKIAALRDIKQAAANGQIVEGDTPSPRPDPEITPDDVQDYINTRINGAANQVVEVGAAAYSELDNKIASNTARITGLETEMKKMGDKMLDLEDRMDGVVATSHAVTNARPMVQDAGEFAMGVGIGAAGSKQALALGGAYQFSQNWSASTTVNYETAGKRSKSQFSAGAGVHYRFK